MEGDIQTAIVSVNMESAPADARFTGGIEGMRTGAAALGVAFLRGTTEGPGAPLAVSRILQVASIWLKYKRLWFSKKSFSADHYRLHFPKHIVIEPSIKRLLGFLHAKNIPIPSQLDPDILVLKRIAAAEALSHREWMPTTLPIQACKIGPLVIAGIPAEITTTAAKRLRQSLLESFEPMGVSTIILAPYANAYSGYITTHQEYEKQLYEGGHTVFGKWTLAAYQTAFQKLAQQMRERGESFSELIAYTPYSPQEKEIGSFHRLRRLL